MVFDSKHFRRATRCEVRSKVHSLDLEERRAAKPLSFQRVTKS